MMSRNVSFLRRGVCASLAAVSLIALSAMNVRPAAAQIVPASDPVQGIDQNVWAERWLQWYFTEPFATNPAINPAAKPGEPYPGVVFLNGVPGNGAASRSITIGEGKYLFFPLINGGGDNTTPYGYAPTTFTALEIVNGVAFGADYLTSYNSAVLFTEIDGVAQSGLNAYRQTNIGFNVHYTSDDNLNGFFGYDASLNTGVYPSDVLTSADGFNLMLKPLPFGKHTLHFGATVDYVDPNGDYLYTGFQDINYTINVVPEPGIVPFAAAAFLPLAGLVLARRRRKTN